MSDLDIDELLAENGFAIPSEDERHRDVSETASSRISDKLKPSVVERKVMKAQLKSRREKARRQRMNKHFSTLASLCNPQEPKTDRVLVLLDAITTIKALKRENEKLRQLDNHPNVHRPPPPTNSTEICAQEGTYFHETMQGVGHCGHDVTPSPDTADFASIGGTSSTAYSSYRERMAYTDFHSFLPRTVADEPMTWTSELNESDWYVDAYDPAHSFP